MAKQNIFDNEVFFHEYSKLREREVNANNLFEIPTLYALLPDLDRKRILDLGCGTGERCIDYLERGAVSVTGIDISEKMLAVRKCNLSRATAGKPVMMKNESYIPHSAEDADTIICMRSRRKYLMRWLMG